MADYTLSAKGTYDGSNFDRGVKGSSQAVEGFSSKCSAAAVAIGNIASNVVSAGFNAISSSMDSAIARVDTLNQFPKVMKNLGYESEVASATIDKLSDGIDGLPTTLDGIVGNARQLALSLGDLDRAGDVAIGLNDGFINFGASADQVTGAIVQLNQMITANKYDMQSWNSINQAAPGYLDTMARSMLGADKKASDLREALNDGKVTSEQFLDQIVKLDKEGADGVIAFSQTARDAVGGIETSMTNARTAITKNLANVIDAVNGSGAISSFFDKVKGAINDAGKAVLPLAERFGGFVSEVLDGRNTMVNELKDTAEEIARYLEPAFDGVVKSAKDTVDEVVPLFKELAPATIDAFETAVEIGSALASGAIEIVSMLASFKDEALAVVDAIGDAAAPAREALHGLVGDIDAGSSSAKDAASSMTTLAAGLALSVVAMRKNADGASLLSRGFASAKAGAQSLKSLISGTTPGFVKYQSVWRDNRQALLEWNRATQSYVETSKPMRASLAATTAGVKLQSAAMRTGAIATKALTVASKALKTALKSIAPVAAITAVLEIANALGRAHEEAKTFQQAVERIDVVGTYSRAFDVASGKADSYSASLQNVEVDVRKVVEEQADLAKSLSDAWSEVGTKNGAVEVYKKDIEELADQSDLSTEAQARLEAAVRGINTICGTSYSVIDAQNGVLSDNKDAILDVAEAWQQSALKQAAANASAELMEQHLKNQVEIQKASKKLADAQAEYDAKGMKTDGAGLYYDIYADAVADAQAELDSLIETDKACIDDMNAFNAAASDAEAVIKGTAQAIVDYMNSTDGFAEHLEGVDFNDFANKLKNIGLTVNDVQAMSWDAFDALVDCYRNGWENVEQVCTDAGIIIPEQVRQTTESAVQGADQEVQEGAQQIEQSAQGAGEAIPSGIEQGASGAPDAMGNIVDATAAEAGQLESKIEENAAGAGDGVAGGIQSAQDQAVAAADALSKLVADHFSAFTEDARFAGQSMAGEHFTQGIEGAQPAAAAAADALSKLVADHSSSANIDAWWAGYNMAQGMAQGIREGASLAVEAARQMAADAVQSAKDEAQINSPSKKMIPVGHAYPEGLAVGATRGIPIAERATAQVARASIASAAKAAESAASAMNTIRIPVLADARDIAPASQNHMRAYPWENGSYPGSRGAGVSSGTTIYLSIDGAKAVMGADEKKLLRAAEEYIFGRIGLAS